MRVIEVNSFEELESVEKELLSQGYKYNTCCEVRKFVSYYKLGGYEIRIKCNHWKG